MGNIPYNITGEILFKLLYGRTLIKGAYLTMQKEVAERLVSPSHARSYGALSVIFQLAATVKLLFMLKPGLFVPPPKVESAFISIVFREEAVVDEAIRRFIKTCFRYKRKFLRHSLEGRFGEDEIGRTLRSIWPFPANDKGRGDRAGRVRAHVRVPEPGGGTMSKIVGFTTTIPVEVIFAAGLRPCDLNNIFVSHRDPQHFIALAEKDGFPKSMCNWIKGLYGVIRESDIDTVITVMEGDCSNTRALAEILSYKGVRIMPFSFPYDRDRETLRAGDREVSASFGGRLKDLKAVETGSRSVRRTSRRSTE